MSSLSVSAVRQRIAAALEAVSGWTQSAWAADLLGRDPKFIGNRLFSVSSPRTAVQQGQRQRRSEGVVVSSEIIVTWLWQLRLDDQIDSYDEALDAEQELIEALAAVSLADLHVILVDQMRQVLPSGWVRGMITLRTDHRIPLQ